MQLTEKRSKSIMPGGGDGDGGDGDGGNGSVGGGDGGDTTNFKKGGDERVYCMRNMLHSVNGYHTR